MFRSPSTPLRRSDRSLRLAAPPLLAGLLLATTACGGGGAERDDAEGCVPGRTQTCSCTPGERGTRTCHPDGTFGACSCPEGDATGDAGRDIASDGPDADIGADIGDGDADAGPAYDPLTLPIRVYPEDGRSEHVESVDLTVPDPTGVDRLYVQAHQPFHVRTGWKEGVAKGDFEPEGAAEIRVNGGDWIEVRDENVQCAAPEDEYGCVAGVYSTIRFAVPVEEVRKGANTVEFKFTGTKGVRSGYRVLGVGFMRPSDPGLGEFDPRKHGAHVGEQFVDEDVGTWRAPEGFRNDEAVAAGAELWNKRDTLKEPNGKKITAACADCHAKDGQDLKYFGYSNRVIRARSRAHGLSAEQAGQIAAYIRNVDLKTEDGDAYEAPGRPWNPPYQPGPEGFGPNGDKSPDDADPVYWAAGAGLEWVLDKPREEPGTARDMLAYMFPASGDPTDPQGVDWYQDPITGERELDWRHVSTDATLNLREMPLAVQFPDWNNWLPKIHPMDAVPDRFVGGEGQRRYREELPDALASGELWRVVKATRKMEEDLRLKDDVTKHSKPSGLTDNQHAISRASVPQWLAVKFWETFHGRHLQDDVDEAYCDDPDRPWCEPLGWPGRRRIPFDIAGHISAPNGIQNFPWIYGSEAQGNALTHLWYQVQMVINPGTQPRSTAQSPVDIDYQRGFVGATEEMGPPSDFRQFLTEIKAWQLHSRTGRVDVANRGWNANQSTLYFLDRVDPSDPTLKRALHTAGVRAWWDQMRRHEISAFPRTEDNNWYYPESNPPDPTEWTSHTNQGQHTYQYLIESADKDLLPASLVDCIGTKWGQPMWPTTGEATSGPAWDEIADWNQIEQKGCDPQNWPVP